MADEGSTRIHDELAQIRANRQLTRERLMDLHARSMYRACGYVSDKDMADGLGKDVSPWDMRQYRRRHGYEHFTPMVIGEMIREHDEIYGQAR